MYYNVLILELLYMYMYIHVVTYLCVCLRVKQGVTVDKPTINCKKRAVENIRP